MHKLISRLLKKRDVKLEELDESEKADFYRWEGILSDGEVTVDKVLAFCESQRKVIEGQWKNMDNSSSKNDRLITMHTVYSNLIEAIKAPEAERKSLEVYLENLAK